MTNTFWGYCDIYGHIYTHHYCNSFTLNPLTLREDDDCSPNPTILFIYGPFEAVDKGDAEKFLTTYFDNL